MKEGIDPRLKWGPRHQYDKQRTALLLDGEIVAMLDTRVDDGRWFAWLMPYPADTFPKRIRKDCTTEATGRHGCQVWAMRHLDHLLAQIALVKARRRTNRTG